MHTQINKMLNVLMAACASPSWYITEVLHYLLNYIIHDHIICLFSFLFIVHVPC